MNISEDKKFLVASTIEKNPRIYLWEISSRTCLKFIVLPKFSIIYILKLAFDNHTICTYSLNEDYTASIMLINIQIN